MTGREKRLSVRGCRERSPSKSLTVQSERKKQNAIELLEREIRSLIEPILMPTIYSYFTTEGRLATVVHRGDPKLVLTGI